MKKLILLTLLMPSVVLAQYNPNDPYGIIPKPHQLVPPPIENNLVYQELQKQYLQEATKNLRQQNQQQQYGIYGNSDQQQQKNTVCSYIGNVLVCN